MAQGTSLASRRRWIRTIAVATAVVGLLTFAFAPSSGASDGTRVRHQKGGGDISFALEAENTNYCLSRAQMAIAGIQVTAAVYDTLAVPNTKGVAVPYLAKSIEPNADSTEWTITLRDGISFHNGEPLDATAVKLNLDNYRGAPDAVNSGPLFSILLQFITDVQVVDPTTVKVVMSSPVTDFASYLYSNGRFGIMAPEQINAGEECATKMIGTGPFKLEEYAQNEKTVVTKNDDYWQKGYPKADQITFVPVPDAAVRVNQLQGGQVDMLHTSSAKQIDNLKSLGSSTAELLEQKPGFREIRYYFLLSSDAPFDNPDARQAFGMAINRDEVNSIVNKGLFDIANGLMDKSAPGYVKQAGYPDFNLKQAKSLVEDVKAASGGTFDVILGTTTDAENSAEAQLMKEQLDKAGINAEIAQFDQATLINKALAGDIDVLLWRNLHGGYSDFNDFDVYPWFSNFDLGFLTNFGQFNNDETESLITQGQAESDLSQVKSTYQDFNKAMAENLYLLPMWFVDWTIAYSPDVDLNLPALPDKQGKPLFVYGRIPVLGLSVS